MINLFWIITFIVYAGVLLYLFEKHMAEIKREYTEENEDKFEQIFKETMKELQDYDY